MAMTGEVKPEAEGREPGGRYDPGAIEKKWQVRDRLQVPAEIDEPRGRELALASPQVRKHLKGGEPARVIYIPGKLVNVNLRQA